MRISSLVMIRGEIVTEIRRRDGRVAKAICATRADLPSRFVQSVSAERSARKRLLRILSHSDGTERRRDMSLPGDSHAMRL